MVLWNAGLHSAAAFSVGDATKYLFSSPEDRESRYTEMLVYLFTKLHGVTLHNAVVVTFSGVVTERRDVMKLRNCHMTDRQNIHALFHCKAGNSKAKTQTVVCGNLAVPC